MAELLLIDRTELRAIIKEEIREAVKEEMENSVSEGDFKERLTRDEAAKFLEISYQSLGKWTRAGRVRQYGSGRKGYYLKKDLMNIKPSDQWKTQL